MKPVVRQIVETVTHYADGTITSTLMCTGKSMGEALVMYRTAREIRAKMVVEDELQRIAQDES